jgi:hypothetical protein
MEGAARLAATMKAEQRKLPGDGRGAIQIPDGLRRAATMSGHNERNDRKMPSRKIK